MYAEKVYSAIQIWLRNARAQTITWFRYFETWQKKNCFDGSEEF